MARPNTVVVNWGNSRAPAVRLAGARIINPFEVVAAASNKLTAFDKMREAGVTTPNFVKTKEEAAALVNQGHVLVCRTKLNAHSGEGIVLAAREQELVDAPLYVQYMKKKKEFRVHVAFGTVIDVQEKRLRSDFEGEPNFSVRNHHTGWVYCRENIEEPNTLRDEATKAIAALGLDFGAVDIIWNAHHNTCYVLEVNTAPGLEGATVESYATTFQQYLTENHLV